MKTIHFLTALLLMTAAPAVYAADEPTDKAPRRTSSTRSQRSSSANVKATCNYAGTTLTFYANGKVKGRCYNGTYSNKGGYYQMVIDSTGTDACGDQEVIGIIIGNTMYEIFSGSDPSETVTYNHSTQTVTHIEDWDGGSRETHPLTSFDSYRVNWK